MRQSKMSKINELNNESESRGLQHSDGVDAATVDSQVPLTDRAGSVFSGRAAVAARTSDMSRNTAVSVDW